MHDASIRAAYDWSAAPAAPAARGHVTVPRQRRDDHAVRPVAAGAPVDGPVDGTVTLDRTVLLVHLDVDGLAGRGLDPVDVAERLAGVVLRADEQTCTVLVTATAASTPLVVRRVQDLDPVEVVVVESGDRLTLGARAARPVSEGPVLEGVVVEGRPVAPVLRLRRSGWSYA